MFLLKISIKIYGEPTRTHENPREPRFGILVTHKNVGVRSCHNYKKDFLDQICPKWIKMDQTGNTQQSKNVTVKSCHICKKDKDGCFILDFFGSDLSKMDQF